MITSILWALLPLCAASAALSHWLTKRQLTRTYNVIIEEFREDAQHANLARKRWLDKYLSLATVIYSLREELQAKS
jgi:hypothetical protein